MVLFNLRIDPATKASLEDLARRDDRSLANYLRRLLARHVEENGSS